LVESCSSAFCFSNSADFDFAGRYTGQLYEQGTLRGIIAGQVVRAEKGKRPRLLSTLGDPDELKTYVKVNDWNQHSYWQPSMFAGIDGGSPAILDIRRDAVMFANINACR
jgi:hypothetical protein